MCKIYTCVSFHMCKFAHVSNIATGYIVVHTNCITRGISPKNISHFLSKAYTFLHRQNKKKRLQIECVLVDLIWDYPRKMTYGKGRHHLIVLETFMEDPSSSPSPSHISFVEIGHEIISTAIRSLLPIQVGQCKLVTDGCKQKLVKTIKADTAISINHNSHKYKSKNTYKQINIAST